MRKIDTTLYFITDSTGWDEDEFLRRVELALMGGATIMQLREKNRTTREYMALAEKVHTLAKKYQVPLIIDDRVDVALAVDAEGVHVGQSDLPVSLARSLMGEDKIVGATTKTVAQAQEAYEQGADYLGVGAIYPTTTKVKTVLTSPDTLRDICQAVPIPVNAIGGLNMGNLDVLQGIPIAGICVVSAIMKATDPRKAAEELKAAAEELKTQAHAGEEKPPKKMKTALTIAGSDSSGGAGIQADLKTMTMNGVFAMSAVTALTAQNTTGVTAIEEASPAFLKEQMDAVFSDIFPDAVKIGMVSSSELIHVIADGLTQWKARHIVVDPVMVATSGSSLLKTEAIQTLMDRLLPLAELVTPNIPEAQMLSGMDIHDEKDMEAAAKIIGDTFGCAVLLKGGHSINDANDLLYMGGKSRWFLGKRIHNPNTHGTGCTLSSAIASNLAKGLSLEESVKRAKAYISGALADMLDLGAGSGPMNHGFALTGEFAKEA